MSTTLQVAEPTPAQAEAGNYRKGHLRWQGLDVSVETPRGGTRKAADGSWEVRDMPAHYGYIRGTEGADGDHVDIYLGEHHESPVVWVVDQVDSHTGDFDEHKVMAGFPSRRHAVEAYDRGFSDGKGPQRRGAVTPMSVGRFKTWVREHDTTVPLAQQRLDAAKRENTRGFEP